MPDTTETLSPVLSLEESIQRLKAEILSQDWRLSEKRADLLGAAFSCLKRRFTNRKTAFAIIVMASNVLLYIKKKGELQVPGSVDFLKEAMAHIVTFYEDPLFDPEQDKKILNSLYRRFTQLKEKIQAEQQRTATSDKMAPEDSAQGEAELLLREAAAQSLSLRQAQQSVESLFASQSAFSAGSSGATATAERDAQQMDQQKVEKLVRELRDSLQRAEEVGSTIRQLLVEVLSNRQLALPSMETFLRSTFDQTGSHPSASPFPSTSSSVPMPLGSPPDGRGKTPAPEPCEKAPLLLVKLGEETIAVEEKFVAARRPIRSERRHYYLKSSTVPLRDFKRVFQGLAKQFNGCLASIKNSTLRSLALPIIAPRGLRLPDKPGENEQEALVLCNGNWCGILLCSPTEEAAAVMSGRQPLNDGDLLQTAHTENGQQFPLLNTVELLKREGHMVVVR